MGLKLSKELSSGVWKTGIFKYDHFSGRKKYESRKPHGTGFKVKKLQNVKMGPPFLFEIRIKKVNIRDRKRIIYFPKFRYFIFCSGGLLTKQKFSLLVEQQAENTEYNFSQAYSLYTLAAE